MEAYCMNEPKLDHGIQTEAPSRDKASMIHVPCFSHDFLILFSYWLLHGPSTERRMIVFVFEYKKTHRKATPEARGAIKVRARQHKSNLEARPTHQK